MKKIKVAQIGTSTNSHGNSIFSSFKKNSDIFEIAGYVDDGIVSSRCIRNSKIWTDKTNFEESVAYDRYDSMMRSFGQIIRKEKQNPWSYDYELELYKTVLKSCGGK